MTYREVKKAQILFISEYVLKVTASFFAGITLSLNSVLNFSPLGVALVSSLSPSLSVFAGLGSLIGIVFNEKVSNTRYFAAIIFALLIKLIYSRYREDSEISVTANCGASLVFSSLLMLVFKKTGVISLFWGIFESAVASSVAFFFFVARESTKDGAKISSLSQKSVTALTVSFAVIVSCLSPVTVYGISFARVLAVAVILSASVFGGEGAGAVSGTAFGIASAISQPGLMFLCGGYAFGGLTAGIFSSTGAFVPSIAFLLSNGLFAFLSTDKTTAIKTLYEVLFGTSLFLLLPRGVKKSLSAFFAPRLSVDNLSFSQKHLSKRLHRSSDALREMSETVAKVGELLNTDEDYEKVFLRVERNACRGCKLRDYCWDKARGETLSEFIDATKRIRSGEGVLSDEFSSRCARVDTVTKTLSSGFFDYLSRQNARRRIGQVQSALKLQFDSVSSLLNSLCEEVEDLKEYDGDTAKAVESALRGLGYTVNDVCCRRDKNGGLFVDVSLKEGKFSQKKIVERLSLVCDRELELQNTEKEGSGSRLSLCDRAKFRIDFASRQYTNKNYTVCGDSFEKFCSDRGRFSMILSDGMGSGTAAAVDATMTAGLMAKLVRSGFEYSSALGLVNSAMLFKSDDERLSTLDISEIDLHTGRAVFYKAGSPATVIRKSKNVGTVSCNALPIGILPEAGFDKSECALSVGDIIVMFSDGAVTEGDEWLKGEVKNFDGTASALADTLIRSAVKRFKDHEDDVTVLVAILQKA